MNMFRIDFGGREYMGLVVNGFVYVDNSTGGKPILGKTLRSMPVCNHSGPTRAVGVYYGVDLMMDNPFTNDSHYNLFRIGFKPVFPHCDDPLDAWTQLFQSPYPDGGSLSRDVMAHLNELAQYHYIPKKKYNVESTTKLDNVNVLYTLVMAQYHSKYHWRYIKDHMTSAQYESVMEAFNHIPIYNSYLPVIRISIEDFLEKNTATEAESYSSGFINDAVRESVKDTTNVSWGYLNITGSIENLVRASWKGLKFKFCSQDECAEKVTKQVADLNKIFTKLGLDLRSKEMRDWKITNPSDHLNSIREWLLKYAYSDEAAAEFKMVLLKGDAIASVYNNFSCGSCMTGYIPGDHFDAIKCQRHDKIPRVTSYTLSENAEIACLIMSDKEQALHKAIAKAGIHPVTGRDGNPLLNQDSTLLARVMVWTSLDGSKYYDRVYPSTTEHGMATDLSNRLVGLMEKAGIRQLRAGSVTAGGSFKANHKIATDLKVHWLDEECFTLPYMDTMRHGYFVDKDTLRVSVDPPKDPTGPVYNVASSRGVHRVLKMFKSVLTGKQISSEAATKVILLSLDKNGEYQPQTGHIENDVLGKQVVTLAQTYHRMYKGSPELPVVARVEECKLSTNNYKYWLTDHLPDDVTWDYKDGIQYTKDTVQAIVEYTKTNRARYGTTKKANVKLVINKRDEEVYVIKDLLEKFNELNKEVVHV